MLCNARWYLQPEKSATDSVEIIRKVRLVTDRCIKGGTIIFAGGPTNLAGQIARDRAGHLVKTIAIHGDSTATRGKAEAAMTAISGWC